MFKQLYVFSRFVDESDLTYAHDKTAIVPNIFNALLINGKQGQLVCFNVALTNIVMQICLAILPMMFPKT